MSGKKNFVVVQDIEKPFEPKLHEDLAKFCTRNGFNYNTVRNLEFPVVFKKKYYISKVSLEE